MLRFVNLITKGSIMAIDLERERLISFSEAAKYLPSDSRPHASTWWRWWRVGVKRIRLETVVCGGRRYTTAEAVIRFFHRVTIATDGRDCDLGEATESTRKV